MLIVKFDKNENLIKKVIFEGHAEFDSYGKDIVCAAASSILITTVNAIMEFDSKAIKYEQNDMFVLENIKEDEITNILLNNMYSLFKELESNYKDNIKICE